MLFCDKESCLCRIISFLSFGWGGEWVNKPKRSVQSRLWMERFKMMISVCFVCLLLLFLQHYCAKLMIRNLWIKSVQCLLSWSGVYARLHLGILYTIQLPNLGGNKSAQKTGQKLLFESIPTLLPDQKSSFVNYRVVHRESSMYWMIEGSHRPCLIFIFLR